MKEMEAQVEKVKERSRERLKKIKELEDRIKSLEIKNEVLIERLEKWAERNFELRQEKMNMTIDEVLEQSKTKQDFKQEQELAKTVDEVKERVMNLDTKGISKGAENENS
jgi:TolA-binding protein